MLHQLEPLVSGLINFQHSMGIFRGLTAPSNQHAAALAIGVGVALVAGVAGVYIIQGQTPWSSTKRRPKPLTAEEWKDAFDADGRLLNDGAQVIGRVRRGGVAPEIRFEVWPFLLGVHELDSTESERKKKKLERRRKFAGLRKQAEALSQRIQEETARKEKEEEMAALKREARAEARRGKKSELSADEVAVDIRKGPEGHQDENGVGPESRSNSTDEKEKRHQIDAQQEDPSPAEPLDNLVSITEFGKTEPAQTSGADDLAESKPGPPETPESADEPESSKSQQSSDPRPPEDAQALEEFQTWLRIIRLDAVRMNAAWIPYAPAQAACDPEKAEEMARAVGLENDEHLEPARRAHAARLVAILEAYAVYDKETGYCQGMSDLLSPFVALIESDAEAFWCFQRFMKTAKHNFRIDERGIRGQLNRIAAILEQGDPELYQHLAKIGAGDCIFAYRMVVVLFRRELSFEQTLCLWEVCWADALAAERVDSVAEAASTVGGTVEQSSGQKKATKELLLYAIAAAVKQRRRKILDECSAMDEVLKECNAMANSIDLWTTLQDARALVQICTKSQDARSIVSQ